MGRIAVLLFFAGPSLCVALAVSLRTTRMVESYDAILGRVLAHQAAARVAADSEGVELPLLLAVASAESGGRADARSGAGAVGLMQLMPSTAAELAAAAGEPRPDLTDPRTSLRLGARYLHRQFERFDGAACAKEFAIAAYNAGPERVQEWRSDGGDPEPGAVIEWIRFAETRAFVGRVLEFEARYRADPACAPPR